MNERPIVNIKPSHKSFRVLEGLVINKNFASTKEVHNSKFCLCWTICFWNNPPSCMSIFAWYPLGIMNIFLISKGNLCHTNWPHRWKLPINIWMFSTFYWSKPSKLLKASKYLLATCFWLWGWRSHVKIVYA